jgi:hypothetical protein
MRRVFTNLRSQETSMGRESEEKRENRLRREMGLSEKRLVGDPEKAKQFAHVVFDLLTMRGEGES